MKTRATLIAYYSLMIGAAVAGFSVGGCDAVKLASTASSTTVDTTDYVKAAYGLRTLYAGTLVVATVYAEQPRCGSPAARPAPLCSSQAFLDQLRPMELIADQSTKSAENAARTLTGNPSLLRIAVTSAQAAVEGFKLAAEAASGKKVN